jgi:hypothetical protein
MQYAQDVWIILGWQRAYGMDSLGFGSSLFYEVVP